MAGEGEHPSSRYDQANIHVCKVLEGPMHGKKRLECEQKGLFD